MNNVINKIKVKQKIIRLPSNVKLTDVLPNIKLLYDTKTMMIREIDNE